MIAACVGALAFVVFCQVKVLYITSTWQSSFSKSWELHEEWKKTKGDWVMSQPSSARLLASRCAVLGK